MDNKSGAILEIVESVFESATNTVLEPTGLTLGKVAGDISESNPQIEGDSILSVLSAAGDGIKIFSSIHVTRETLRAIHPSGASASVEDLRDWCGEINNQLVGAAKNQLLAYECKVMMGLPTLIQGENLASIGADEASVSRREYASDRGVVVTYLSTVIAPGFNMRDQPDESLTGITQGGELDFF